MLPDDVARDIIERAPQWFVGLAGLAGLVGLVGLAGLVGLVGVELFLAASVAHVRPQYGWTLVPSLNFGFLLHCYRIRIRG